MCKWAGECGVPAASLFEGQQLSAAQSGAGRGGADLHWAGRQSERWRPHTHPTSVAPLGVAQANQGDPSHIHGTLPPLLLARRRFVPSGLIPALYRGVGITGAWALSSTTLRMRGFDHPAHCSVRSNAYSACTCSHARVSAVSIPITSGWGRALQYILVNIHRVWPWGGRSGGQAIIMHLWSLLPCYARTHSCTYRAAGYGAG